MSELAEFVYTSSVYSSPQHTSLTRYSFHPCGHPATLLAVQCFSSEDSFEWLQGLHLFLQEHLEKAGDDCKVCSDRHWQPAEDFVVGDYIWFSGEHVHSVCPSKLEQC